MDSSSGLTIPETAAVLGCSLKTVRRRIAAGKLPAERIITPQGHVWLVRLEGHQVDRPDLVSASGRQDGAMEMTRTVASQVTESLSRRLEELARENERLKQELAALQVAQDTTLEDAGPSEAPTGLWARFLGWLYAPA